MWDQLTMRMQGTIIALEPLDESHRAGLRSAAQHSSIWQWLPHTADAAEPFDRWFDDTVEADQAGQIGVFATVDANTKEPIGSTRYLSLRPEHQGLEIGYTWLTPTAWNTGANTEAKLLMLEHAFGTLGCIRVEFKTDMRNERSRKALAALPAKFEGTFRNHMLVPGIGRRDSAYYSIIDTEWPAVRANLQEHLSAIPRRQTAPR